MTRAREAAAEDPRSPLPHEVLGSLMLRRGDIAQAIESFNKAISLNANDVRAHLGLGNAYERKSDVERAEASYRKVIQLAPRNPLGYNNLAWLYASNGRDLKEALNLAQQARALAPNVPTIIDTLGYVHYKRGEFARAAPLLQQAAQSMRDNAMLQYHLGMTMYRLGRNEDAVVALRRSLELDSKLAEGPQARKLLRELGG
jgi:Flp pilus assembly protein TadD